MVWGEKSKFVSRLVFHHKPRSGAILTIPFHQHKHDQSSPFHITRSNQISHSLEFFIAVFMFYHDGIQIGWIHIFPDTFMTITTHQPSKVRAIATILGIRLQNSMMFLTKNFTIRLWIVVLE